MQLKKLDASNLSDFEDLFSGADSSGCYCAVWRGMDDTWEARCQDPEKPNRAITRKNIDLGFHIGFIAYDGTKMVGWTASGPKTDFPFLKQKLGSRLSAFSSSVWAIGCLVLVHEDDIRLLSDLIGAIILRAKQAGATHLEAYPTRPWDEDRNYRGSYELYQSLGFTIKGSEKDAESSEVLLMQLELPNGNLQVVS